MKRLLVLLCATSIAYAEEGDDHLQLAYVSGELKQTVATFHARYIVDTQADMFEYAYRSATIPEDASVTSVTVHGPDGVHKLGLGKADKARDAFQHLGATNASPPGRWAVLVEENSGNMTLSLASPVAATLTIDIEMQVPTCYFRDARYARIPVVWKRNLSPTLRTRTSKDAALATACSSDPEEAATWVAFSAPAIGEDHIAANAARIDLAEAHIARLELAAAKELGAIPGDLATVLVVDTSRSMTPRQLETQRELVKAYAAAAGDTRIQVIAYARTARALLPSWTGARNARARLDRELRALAPRNGSNADAGMIEAGRWLAQIDGTKRVVLMTDELMSRRMHARLDSLARELPAGTLVHVVSVSEANGLERLRGGFGEQLAEGTGGIAVVAGFPDDKDKEIDPTMLLRPTGVDYLEISAPGWKRFSEALTTSCKNRLDEGQGCVWWGEGDAVAGPVAAAGMIWGKRWSRVLSPDPTRAVELARELVNMRVLGDRAQQRAAEIARAASSEYSFYAVWGGDGGYAGGWIIGGGSHSFRTIGAPSVTIGHVLPGKKLPSLDLSPQFRGVAARCNLGDTHVEAEVETTFSEIVEVTVLGPPSVAQCVEDAIWDTPITVFPAMFQASSHVVLN